MILEQLIAGLNKDLGTEIQVGEDNLIVIAFDGLEVALQELPDEEVLLVDGIVGELPAYPLENLYNGLLMSNHFFEYTRGATFSLDSENKDIHLAKRLETTNLSYEMFHDNLESFVNTLESWRDIVKHYTGGDDGNADESFQPSGENMSMSNFIKV